jgi:hypothetical protein
LESVAEKLREKTLRKELDSLPTGLDETYNNAMERIQYGQDAERCELAMKVLMWLSYALAPLRIMELQYALAAMELDPDDEDIDRDDLYSEKILIDICAGLIILEPETSVIRFVHHSAEAYFASKREALFQNAEKRLARTCVAYLSLALVNPTPKILSGSWRPWAQLDPFYVYSHHNWGHHAREARIDADDSVLSFLERLKTRTGLCLCTDSTQCVTGLGRAAYFGLLGATARLLGKGHLPFAADCFGRTPVSQAAGHGHIAVLSLLLEHWGPHELGGWSGETFRMAAANGHEEALRLQSSIALIPSHCGGSVSR